MDDFLWNSEIFSPGPLKIDLSKLKENRYENMFASIIPNCPQLFNVSHLPSSSFTTHISWFSSVASMNSTQFYYMSLSLTIRAYHTQYLFH